MTHPLPAHHSCPPGHRPTHPHTWTLGLVDTSWYVLKELREGWKSSEAKGFITVKTLFFLPSKGWGEEGVERENKSFLCRGRLKDRAIIAALRHSGSSLGNARGLVGSYMSHISCIGFISLCSFKKWFIFMMIDTDAHWQGSLVAQQQGGLLEQCDARAVGWWCSEVMGQWVVGQWGGGGGTTGWGWGSGFRGAP